MHLLQRICFFCARRVASSKTNFNQAVRTIPDDLPLELLERCTLGPLCAIVRAIIPLFLFHLAYVEGEAR